MECVYKTLAACLAQHIQGRLMQKDIQYLWQKTESSEGCREHNVTLKYLFEDQKVHKRNQYMSTSQISLKMRNMNTDCACLYCCEDSSTRPITRVRHGCPLLMLMFNIGITPILTEFGAIENARSQQRREPWDIKR